MHHYFDFLLKFVHMEGEPSLCSNLHNKVSPHTADQSVVRQSHCGFVLADGCEIC